VCYGARAPRHRPYRQLQSLPRPSGPWKEILMDFITGLLVCCYRGGEVDAILVIVNRFTKINRFFPVFTEIYAAELAELFYREIQLRYGTLAGIVSDRGSLFTSEFWSELCF
jgi:hypothetical protein